MPRRRRLASRARLRCVRDRPASLGPSPIGKRPLVAMTTWSRTPTGPSANCDDLLGTAAGVDVGGVDAVAAPLDEQIELRVETSSSHSRPNVIAPKTLRRHDGASAAQVSVLHGRGPYLRPVASIDAIPVRMTPNSGTGTDFGGTSPSTGHPEQWLSMQRVRTAVLRHIPLWRRYGIPHAIGGGW